MKAKVCLWTDNVKVVRMGTEEANNARRIENGSLTNVCTVLQSMMPTNDVDKLVSLVVETVLSSLDSDMTYGDTIKRYIESRVYNAIMAQSIFNK